MKKKINKKEFIRLLKKHCVYENFVKKFSNSEGIYYRSMNGYPINFDDFFKLCSNESNTMRTQLYLLTHNPFIIYNKRDFTCWNHLYNVLTKNLKDT